MSEFICQPLATRDDRKGLNCGVRELDECLKQRAGPDMRRRVADVFVLVSQDDPDRVAGFYTLSSASIVLDELRDRLRTRLPRYPVIPAVLIGRLARDESFPGFGKLLLLDALARALEHSTEIASTLVLVDAKNDHASTFYRRYGFMPIAQHRTRMFSPMKTVETLFKGSS